MRIYPLLILKLCTSAIKNCKKWQCIHIKVVKFLHQYITAGTSWCTISICLECKDYTCRPETETRDKRCCKYFGFWISQLLRNGRQKDTGCKYSEFFLSTWRWVILISTLQLELHKCTVFRNWADSESSAGPLFWSAICLVHHVCHLSCPSCLSFVMQQIFIASICLFQVAGVA